ncbi:protein-L-isoaspartate O-methyltransferase family protein [Neisseria sp. Ec49-e6-T10]|uniref:protein-L-isoaspartate O-methyltransferase family protein n=1 Tax=Neisseria sp. Ec49-e6-T10 TaxID=3140744 RepID=UPI003EC075D5
MDFSKARFNMVEQQIRPWSVLDLNVLDHLLEIPREAFVASGQERVAYTDTHLPLPNGGVMLEPKIVARMIQALAIKPTDKVLEVGTGSGYATALLSKLAQSVLTVDIDQEQQEKAKQTLTKLAYQNINYHVADGLQNIDQGKFDAIYIGGACDTVPEALKEQLAENGRLVIIVGRSAVMQAMLYTLKDNQFTEKVLFDTNVPYLTNTKNPGFSGKFEF